MRCEHEHDDGAYVLGALSPAEKARYERHLATCVICRDAVAEVAALPDLLARLDAADFAKLLDPTLSSPSSYSSTSPKATFHYAPRTPEIPPARRRKHLRTRILTSTLAMAVVALLAGVGVMFLGDRTEGNPPPPQGPTVAMTPVDSSVPISARLTLAGANGGTKVDLTCSYDKNSPSKKSYTVRLMAYGPDDEYEQLGSWIAAPGKEFSMSGTTHFSLGVVDRLALVRNAGKEQVS